MARKRYTVLVTGKRYDAPAYTYVAYEGVKPGKVERLVEDAAEDALAHETRGDFTGYLRFFGKRATVRVAQGQVRFYVRAEEK